MADVSPNALENPSEASHADPPWLQFAFRADPSGDIGPRADGMS